MKNNFVAYLLWLLGGFGVLGLHRFYLGRWVTGLIWLCTGGVFFIGAIIDLFLIPQLVEIENISTQLVRGFIGSSKVRELEPSQTQTEHSIPAACFTRNA